MNRHMFINGKIPKYFMAVEHPLLLVIGSWNFYRSNLIGNLTKWGGAPTSIAKFIFYHKGMDHPTPQPQSLWPCVHCQWQGMASDGYGWQVMASISSQWIEKEVINSTCASWQWSTYLVFSSVFNLLDGKIQGLLIFLFCGTNKYGWQATTMFDSPDSTLAINDLSSWEQKTYPGYKI